MNERLFLELKRRGLHQYQLAGLAGISEATLTRVLYGRIQPSIDIKQRIAKALKLSVKEIFSDSDKEPKTLDEKELMSN